ncbi:MAG: C25 family cysteine peptidase [Thermodesulfobacteriota bacterium]
MPERSDPPRPSPVSLLHAQAAIALWQVAGEEAVLEVQGTSMLPLIRPGDRVQLRFVPAAALRSGDIMVFRQGSVVVAHRYLGAAQRGGTRRLCQKGDNQRGWGWLDADAVIGRVLVIHGRRGARHMDHWPWTWLNPLYAALARCRVGIREALGRCLRLALPVLAILLAWGAGRSWAEPAPGFEVLRRDSAGMEVAFRLPQLAFRAGQAGQEIAVPGLAGGRPAPGQPDLPRFGLLIKVPAASRIQPQVLEASCRFVPGVRPRPVPGWEIRPDGSLAEVFAEDAGAYQGTETVPAELARLEPAAILRRESVARLLVQPVRYDPARGGLAVCDRLRIAVAAAGPWPAAPGEAEPPAEAASSPLVAAAPAVREYLRIEVREDGIHRITFEDLAALGLSPDRFPRRGLRLYGGGQERALRIVTAAGPGGPNPGGRLAPGDAIEFFGQAADTRYTGTSVYFLIWPGGQGLRMAWEDGRPSGRVRPLASFLRTVHVEKSLVGWDNTPGAPAADTWFWERITGPVVREYEITLPAAVAGQDGASLTLALQGRSSDAIAPDHHVAVSLNGTPLGDLWWDGPSVQMSELAIPAGVLVDGVNRLQLSVPNDTGAALEVLYLNWVEVRYQSLFAAEADGLACTIPDRSRSLVVADGFATPPAPVYDVTDPARPKVILRGLTVPTGQGQAVAVETRGGGERRLLLAGSGRVLRPPALARLPVPDLVDPANQADYLMIADQDLAPSLARLRDYHQAMGLTVRVVTTREIYDSFGTGLPDPEAIKAFLRYAYHHWQRPAPLYVLLAGQATMDPRGYLGPGKVNQLPAHFTATADLGMTPDDTWYACVDGDDPLPDLMVGRLPAANAGELAAVVDKILRHQEQAGEPASSGGLFVADNDPPGYAELSHELAAYLPPSLPLTSVDLADFAQGGAARAAILSALNDGVRLANYVGHGAVFNWAGEMVLQVSDIPSLTNGASLPMVLAWTCLNGYFSHPSQVSLAEALVAAPDQGAIAVFAPSGLTYLWDSRLLSHATLAAIFETGSRRFGEIATTAKVQAFAQGAATDIIAMYTLFGDPAASLPAWPE